MSHFYGNLKGNRGEATRCGTKTSGMLAAVRSFDGSVTVTLSDQGGETVVWISVAQGSHVGGRTLWTGPISKLLTAGSLAARR